MGTNERSVLPAAASWTLALGVVVCALVFVNDAWLELPGYAYPKELVLGVSGFGAAALCAWRARQLRVEHADWALALLVLLGVVSAATVATNAWMAWRAAALTTGSALVYWSARSLAGPRLARLILFTGAGLVALIGLLVVLESHGLISGLSLPRRAPGATLGNRNYAAHFLVLGLPLIVACIVSVRSRGGAVLGAAGLAIAVAAVVLTRSRAGWLAGLVLIICLPVLLAFMRAELRKLVRWRAVLVAAAVLVGVAMATLLPSALTWGDRGTSDTLGRLLEHDRGSGRGRLIQYGNTNDMIRDHLLLGVGPGNWFLAYPGYASADDPSYSPVVQWQTPAHATGDWLGLAAERGVPALLAILAFLGLLARAAFERLRSATELAAAAPALASLGLLVALAVVASLDCVIQLALPAMFVWLVLGALAQPGTGGRVLPMGRGAARGLAGGLVLVGALVTAMNARQTAACLMVPGVGDPPEAWERMASTALGQYSPHLQAAMLWHDQGRCDRALEQARACLADNPSSAVARRIAEACALRR